jgi:poly-gamma-glutamate capsule biosynthesis protein CapA/YwtB (metallophosphatase superfamily)
MQGRRDFLRLLLGVGVAGVPLTRGVTSQQTIRSTEVAHPISLFLCGDVMLGRGVDQILPHPSPPVLYESYVNDARRYLELAEHKNGEIPHPAPFAYVWGDALPELAGRHPDARIINLETSVTRSDKPWPKGINYRLHPDNVPCLAAAAIDCCVLANNHVLDWERDGLVETLATLRRAGIRCAGAGEDLASAQAPAILELMGGGRVLVFAGATEDSGVPVAWSASRAKPGVYHLPDLSAKTVLQIAARLRRHRREGDCVIFSLHWGGNWGYEVSTKQRDFAHGLIEEAEVDVVYGHSSHHPKALEVFQGRLILYGCGDFLNDYEGIEGHEEYRGDLGLMYFPSLDRNNGQLIGLELVPTKIRKFRIERAEDADRRWLLERMKREYHRFGCDLKERHGAFSLQIPRKQ